MRAGGNMITVNEAKKIIEQTIQPQPIKRLPLAEGLGLILAEDVVASLNFPPFRQSAMDGYAFNFGGWNGQPLQTSGEMQAGATDNFSIEKNEAARIFTGAPLPEGADTVIMQEKVELHQNSITITDKHLEKGTSVREIASELAAGEVAIEKGNLLTPAAIGLIAGIGQTHVSVYAQPSVAIIVTGKELQTPGEPLQFGQVYQSNSFALTAALQQTGIKQVHTYHADDDLAVLSNTIEKALAKYDLILLTGGVSVGDYDFVAQALHICGVEKLFHRIRQKPGKPLFFGKKQQRIVFGLPGNPSSVLTCFYEYVLLALQLMLQRPPFVKILQLPLHQAYEKKTGLQHFLKGKRVGEEVSLLDAQELYRMRSFAVADCLIVFPEDGTVFNKGDLVEVHVLPI